MEVIKEILSDKVDYLNALRNAPELPVAPPPVIEIAETVIQTPVIAEMPAPPPVNASVTPIAVPKKGIKLLHVLLSVAALGVIFYLINKRKKQKEQENYNGRR